MESDPGRLLFLYALQNAVKHNATPRAGTVIGTLLGKHPELRGSSKDLAARVGDAIAEVEAIPVDERQARLETLAPHLAEELTGKKEKRQRELPALESAEEGVVMRFAPNPSGPLHLGHARAAVLNDYYVRRYGGRYLLRIEDTDPRRVDPDAYQMVQEDVEWLGLGITDIIYQSDRLEIYYEYGRRLIGIGGAYICTCDAGYFRDLKIARKSCPCRGNTIEENLDLWDRMLAGEFPEGAITMRVKTELEHPDPALRDFPAFRIVSSPIHPRIDAAVYPLMNFSVAVDDHLLGITHVIRGKDHIANTRRQKYIFDYFGWKIPAYLHYGRMSISGLVLSTSGMREGISEGRFSGWDDIRLGTLRAIARRGIRAEAVRRAVLDIGIGATDISFSWENLYARNKEIIDPVANRYSFVPDPVAVTVTDAPAPLVAEAALHPNDPARGTRRLVFEGTVLVSRHDLEGHGMVRLKDLFNATVAWDGSDPVLTYAGASLGDARKAKAPIIQWLPAGAAIPCILHMPESPEEMIVTGCCEPGVAGEVGTVVQFERIGFARIESAGADGVVAYFAHR